MIQLHDVVELFSFVINVKAICHFAPSKVKALEMTTGIRRCVRPII